MSFCSDTHCQQLKLHARLERYATALDSFKRTPTSPEVNSSPIYRVNGLPNHIGNLAASLSNPGVNGIGNQISGQDHDIGIPLLSTVSSPTIVNGSYWVKANGVSAPPKIFPGIVHERTRRGSLRQGSTSEKWDDGSSASIAGRKPLSIEQDQSYGTVQEESAEHAD